MLRDRKNWLASILGISLLIATASVTAAAVGFGLKTTGATTSGNVVYVSVANSTSSSQAGLVSVAAVVGGKVVAAQAFVTLAPGQSAVVPVTFSGSPTRIISCGIATDGGSPV